MVERRDVEAGAERLVAREPVEIRGGRPAMEERDGGSPRRAVHLAEVNGAEVTERDVTTWRQRRGDGRGVGDEIVEQRLGRRRRGIVDQVAQIALTVTIVTRSSAPVGAV
jgi:hypothetical protein